MNQLIKIKVGIIGQGFVGNAVRHRMEKYFEVFYYDKDPNKESNVDSIYSVQDNSDVVFLCVPTPMKKTGECDTSIIEMLLSQLNNKPTTVIIKSTIPPGTTEMFIKTYTNLSIVFNPEFLTEANAINDYNNQKRIILGMTKNIESVINVFKASFPLADIIIINPTSAEMVKYITNTFLSTKISFANEMYQICEMLNISYDTVMNTALHDERLGKSHWRVPGLDGDFGYGGHCFPKDISALKFHANKNGVPTQVLDAVIDKNDQVRRNRDWEKQIGRAVSE